MSKYLENPTNRDDLAKGVRRAIKEKESDTSIFSEIYLRGKWGKSSGPGSSVSYNTEFIPFLRDWLQEHNVSLVVDIGCGMWEYSSRVYSGLKVLYMGIDCVPFIIERNRKEYGASDRAFLCLDVIIRV